MQDHGYFALPDLAPTVPKPCQAMTIKVEQCHEGPDLADSSDAESFYSATSTAKRRRQMTQTHRRRNPKASETATTATDFTANLGPQHSKTHNTQRASRFFSHVSSTRSQRMASHVNVPARHSSLTTSNKKKPHRSDLVNLHRQSCQLFSSLDGMLALSREFTPLPSTTTSRSTTRHASISTQEPPAFLSSSPVSVSIGDDKPEFVMYSTFLSTTASSLTDTYHSSSPTTRSVDSDTPLPRQHALNSMISWTSNATRRAEYEAIDRAHSGIRGFLKRTLPDCVQSRAKRRRNFYSAVGVDAEVAHSADDGDSVRRFRVDLDDDDDDGGTSEKLAEKKSTERRKSWWMCFQS